MACTSIKVHELHSDCVIFYWQERMRGASPWWNFLSEFYVYPRCNLDSSPHFFPPAASPRQLHEDFVLQGSGPPDPVFWIFSSLFLFPFFLPLPSLLRVFPSVLPTQPHHVLRGNTVWALNARRAAAIRQPRPGSFSIHVMSTCTDGAIWNMWANLLWHKHISPMSETLLNLLAAILATKSLICQLLRWKSSMANLQLFKAFFICQMCMHKRVVLIKTLKVCASNWDINFNAKCCSSTNSRVRKI